MCEPAFSVGAICSSFPERFPWNLAQCFIPRIRCADGMSHLCLFKVKLHFTVKWLSLRIVSSPYLPHSLKDFLETCLKCLAHWGDVQKARVTLAKAPDAPHELCWSVPGAVKRIHHRSLLFNTRLPPLRKRRLRLVSAFGPSYRSERFRKIPTAFTSHRQSLAPPDAVSWTLGSAISTQNYWKLDHRCFASFARAVIKRCTNFGGAVVKRFTSGHGIVGTVSGAGATIHCSDELWFGVGMEVSVRDQNLAINKGRNGPGIHLESRCRWVHTSFTSNLFKVTVKMYYHGC